MWSNTNREVVHQLMPVQALVHVERNKINIFGFTRLVCEGPLNSVQVVRANRNQRALPVCEEGKARNHLNIDKGF